MNIKEAQDRSGVGAENIRFYEKQGLLSPKRNKDNDYREYSPEDIRTLKRIRALRMLDMPLPQIKAVLEGSVAPGDAAAIQRQRLEERSAKLQAAIDVCRELSTLSRLDDLDEDSLLTQMDAPARQDGFFRQWMDDYRRVAQSEHEKRFTFFPDGEVTTPAQFTAALLAYGEENGLDVIITKEGMYPEFTIDGVEYTALRNYTAVWGCPVATIACEVKCPADFEPVGVKPWRRRLQKAWYYAWCPIFLSCFLLLPRLELLTSWEGRLLVITGLAAVGLLSLRSYILVGNENGKRGRP